MSTADQELTVQIKALAGKNTPEIGSPTGRWAGQIFRTLNLVQHRKILAEGRSPSLADHIAARRLERLDLDREFLVRGAHVGLSDRGHGQHP